MTKILFYNICRVLAVVYGWAQTNRHGHTQTDGRSPKKKNPSKGHLKKKLCSVNLTLKKFLQSILAKKQKFCSEGSPKKKIRLRKSTPRTSHQMINGRPLMVDPYTIPVASPELEGPLPRANDPIKRVCIPLRGTDCMESLDHCIDLNIIFFSEAP